MISPLFYRDALFRLIYLVFVCSITAFLVLATQQVNAKDALFDPARFEIEDHDLTVEKLQNLQKLIEERRKNQRFRQQPYEQYLRRYAVQQGLKPKADILFDSKNKKTAVQRRTECANGQSASCAKLGDMYTRGKGTNKDEFMGYALSFLACKAGDDSGCHNIRYTTKIGFVSRTGPFLEISHFKKRCEEGFASACQNLGYIYYSLDHPDVRRDKELGKIYYQKACKLGKKRSCSLPFKMPSVEENRARCEENNAAGCYLLARDFAYDRAYKGRKQRKQNWIEAEKLFYKSCNLGHSRSCDTLARWYEKGERVSQDLSKALALYEQACKVPRFPAQSACIKVARQWETGQNTSVDLKKALAFYKLGCGSGSSNFHCRNYWRLRASSFKPFAPMADQEFSNKKRRAASLFRKRCIKKRVSSCKKLAELYLGEKDKKRQVIAAYIFERACDLGDASSCLQAGKLKSDHTSPNLFLHGCKGGVDASCVAYAREASIDKNLRLDALEKKCRAGGGQSCFLLASSYAHVDFRRLRKTGLYQKKDEQRAKKLLKRACKLGDGDACTYLARETDNNPSNDYFDIFETDIKLSRKLYRKGCLLKSAWGCMQASAQVDNPKLSYTYMKKACKLNKSYCKYLRGYEISLKRQKLTRRHGPLGAVMHERFDGVNSAYIGHVRRARALCKTGEQKACLSLGYAYQTDYRDGGAVEGTVIDWSRALFKQACQKGEAKGCTAFGSSFHYIGEKSNHKIAYDYYQKACAMGEGLACVQLASAHDGGHDFPENKVSMRDFYKKGCAFGNEYACSNLSTIADCLISNQLYCKRLGNMYLWGRGKVAINHSVARHLYQLGCEKKDEEACQALKKLNNVKSPFN